MKRKDSATSGNKTVKNKDQSAKALSGTAQINKKDLAPGYKNLTFKGGKMMVGKGG